MADEYYDPYYDEQEPDWEALGDPFLMPNQYLLGDLSKGGDPEAYDIATFGRQLDNEKKLNAILRDPFFNYRVATETGENTFPYEQLFQPGNPWLPDPTGLGGSGGSQDYTALMNLINMAMGGGAPNGGGGGGSGGGGGYGGNRFTPLPDGGYLDEEGELVIDTPTVSSMLRSTNPDLQAAGKSLEAGYDPASVIAKLYETTPDPELRTLYADQVKEGFKELAGASSGRNSWLSQQALNSEQEALEGPGVGEASELAKTAAKWGVVNPLAQYGTEEMPLPDDLMPGLTPYMADPKELDRLARSADQEARAAERDAVYGSPGVMVQAPEPGTRGLRPPRAGRGWLDQVFPSADAIARAARGGQEMRPGEPVRGVRRVPTGEPADASYYGVDLSEGLRPDRWNRAFSRSEPSRLEETLTPGEPVPVDREPVAVARPPRPGWGDLLGLGLDRDEEVDGRFWLSPKAAKEQRGRREVDRNPRAPLITRDNGQTVRTNSAGVRAQRKRGTAAYYRGSGPAEQQAIQNAYMGMALQEQGRTPQRDAMSSVMNYLRRSGMRV